MVESKTYTDSINFFAAKEPIFLFLSFYSCSKEETHVVSAVFAVSYLTNADKKMCFEKRKAGAGVVFKNMYWAGSGIGYLFQMSWLVKCVMTPRHSPSRTSPHSDSLQRQNNQSWISIFCPVL